MPILASFPTISRFAIDSNFKNGSTSASAAPSAAYIKNITGTNTNGVYWIDLPTVGPKQVYCIMDSAWNGGGWMMALKATRGTTFNYFANYWTTANTLNPAEYNRNDGDAKFDTFNYFPAVDIMAAWPDIGAGGSIGGVGMWTWLQNNFNNGTRVTPLSFFSTPASQANYISGMAGASQANYIGQAKSFAGWSGAFSSQNAVNFYGFNYVPSTLYYGSVAAAARVRWGFGWNENGEGNYPWTNSAYNGSNDVSGGIGMDSGFGNYSAGDRVSCCQDATGINRSARVEIFIR